MTRERRFIGIMAMAVVLGLLVALPAISGALMSDQVTVKFAIFVPDYGKWRVLGKAAPGNTVTVKLGARVVGTSAPATENGRWKVFVRDSAVVARPGDSITATSTAGGTAIEAVIIR